MPNQSHERYYLLTPREVRLLRLLAAGKTSIEMAAETHETVAEVRALLKGLAARLRAA